MRLHERALAAVGRLDGVTTILPSTPLFLYMYIRKEASLSSQIEGTQSSLSDLLLFEKDEAPAVPLDDVTEVSNYVAAIEHGVTRMRGGFPSSLRLIREMHGILLKSGRDAAKQPGEFRRSQNWIGGTRPGNALFVPPPHDRLNECMGAGKLSPQRGPGAAPSHPRGPGPCPVRDDPPFLDGNGRLGRLLITLILCEAGIPREPILYLSLFLKSRRDDYYRLLQEVRQAGTWENWVEFFLTGVAETAEQAVATARELMAMFEDHRQKIAGVGRAAPSALRVHELMQAHPIVTIQTVSSRLGVSFATTSASLEKLTEIGVVRENTGRRRGRIYVYTNYLALLDRGTDPLPA